MNSKADNLAVEDEVAVGKTWLFLRGFTGFEMEAAKGGFLMACHTDQTKNPKKFERFPFLVRIPFEGRQNSVCRLESMGTIRLAVATIAGLMVLSGMESSSAPYCGQMMSV